MYLTLCFSLAPSAVYNLTTNYYNSTSVWLSWERPEGDLDTVTVTLSINGTSHRETTLPPNVTDVTVDQLIPGSAYQVVVMSKSGELRNQSELTVRTGAWTTANLCCVHLLRSLHGAFIRCAAPAPVSLLALSPSYNGSLLLSWSPPLGHWENYGLLLFDGSQQVVNATLNRDAEKFIFPASALTPGRLYRAVLRVESGGVMAESSCEAATGQMLQRHLKVTQHCRLSEPSVLVPQRLLQ